MGLFDRFRKDHAVAKEVPSPGVTPARRPPSPSLGSGQPRFAVIDVETTGLSAGQHRIIELAVVTTDPWGRVLDEWVTRVNPQGPVGATHIHGITAADVADAPAFADIVSPLNQRLAGAAIAAHHARFDLAFVRAEYDRAGWDLPQVPALCTLKASEHHLPHLERRRLADCCWAVGTPLTGAHSALGDARATAALLAAYMHPHIGTPPLAEHLNLTARAGAVSWPTQPSRAPSSAETGPMSGKAHSAPSTRALHVMANQAKAPVPRALVELVERFSLVDALDEGAPSGALSYLEKLAEVLEDGEVSASEAAELTSVAETENLAADDIACANQAFVLALAHAALDDGKVTRAERTELQSVSDLLGVNPRIIPALLKRAELARDQRLSVGLTALPAGWAFGEPLRVGDRVVFTGCDGSLRDRLEERSEQLGVRISSAVSIKTAMLVTDGSMDGVKAAKAREIGMRVEDPSTYVLLLDHLQPARARDGRKVAPGPGPAPAHPGTTPGVPEATATSTETPPELSAPSPADVRAWARDHGYEIGTRGRLHRDVLDAYEAAHPAAAPSESLGPDPR